MPPKVSILLPSLNAREFLESRIESLLQQTFPDWEAIVLDSQSTDGTWEFFQSVARTDSRFQLHQVPRDGLYAALNRGLELATGDYFHIATCDDSMSPDFLAQMLEAFSRCPKADIAACDVRLINRHGDDLSHDDLLNYLSRGASRNLFSLSVVRTAFPNETNGHLNYRPEPHDCLLHFDGRSVYLSLNQLLIRTARARATGPFKTSIGSVADFDWLLRLTKSTGTVHLPKKLALWRFHGNQLSLHRDDSRAFWRKVAAENALDQLVQEDPALLSENDRAALLLPLKLDSTPKIARALRWTENVIRLGRMSLERPNVTLRALRRSKFRFGTRRHTLVAIILQGMDLAPKRLE